MHHYPPKGYDKVNLVGYSMGGLGLLRAAELLPADTVTMLQTPTEARGHRLFKRFISILAGSDHTMLAEEGYEVFIRNGVLTEYENLGSVPKVLKAIEQKEKRPAILCVSSPDDKRICHDSIMALADIDGVTVCEAADVKHDATDPDAVRRLVSPAISWLTEQASRRSA